VKVLKQRWGVFVAVLLAAATGYAIRAVRAGGIPTTNAMTYSGLLEDGSGAPLKGSHTVEVKLWAAATGGAQPLCDASPGAPIDMPDGRFQIALPDACATSVHANTTTWTEVLVDGLSLGRSANGAVPYSEETGHAVAADNGVPSGAVMAFNLASCPAGWSPMSSASGRAIVGTSGSLALGAVVGSDSVTLSVAQMPSHGHTLHDPGHSHAPGGAAKTFLVDSYPTDCPGSGYTAGGTYITGGQTGTSICGGYTQDGSNTTGITLDAAGGGQAFDNRQASLALLYCQKN
jgi:microcystin-dependent protein